MSSIGPTMECSFPAPGPPVGAKEPRKAGSVRVDDVDADAPPADRSDHLPQRLGGTTAPADHGAQVLRVYAHLQALPPARVDEPDPDVVRVVDDAFDEVLQRGPERPVSSRRRRHRRGPLRSRRRPRGWALRGRRAWSAPAWPRRPPGRRPP